MYTNLGTPSNLDLAMTSQGQANGREMLAATHSLRIYTDKDISFNVNRNNAITTGPALICISEYLAYL